MMRSPLTPTRHRRRRFACACAAIATAAVASFAQGGRFLFDASKSEMAGNADWVIDSDSKLNGESNPSRIPTPTQANITASTAETYWNGGISAWGVTMVKHGNSVESLPRSGTITYGSATNAQDLTHYKTFVICEPNNAFSTAEKQALLSFVRDGGGLFMVSDHDNADRDNDGIDAAGVWNDFFTNNGVVANPFGMSVNLNDISQVSTNVSSTAVFKTGVAGTASNLQFNDGATLTLSAAANPTVRAAVWTNGSQTNSNVMMAYANYGLGRVVMLGDSSPADDGTGDTGDTLYYGWTTGTNGTLISNASDWVNGSAQSGWDATVGGSWANAAAWTGAVPDGMDFVADFHATIAADATITLDKPRTVLAMRFTGTRGYTIAGSSTLTFGGTPVNTMLPGIIITGGSHAVVAPITLSGRADFNVVPSVSSLTVDTIHGAQGYGFAKSGAGRLNLTRIDGDPALQILGGSIRFAGTSATAAPTEVASLFMAADTTLDLGVSGLVIDYAGSTPLATIQAYLDAGQLKTTATGLTIGYAEASTLGISSFLGAPVDSTMLLLRPTKPGDATLDLAVNFDDLLALAKHYNAPADWSGGDFNRDGTVTFDDLLVLAKNYQAASSAALLVDALDAPLAADWALAQSLVPEPISLGLLLSPLAMRRRR